MSNSIQDIADHLRAANFEHVRAIIEPDDNMVLIDYLEGQGFISAEAKARDEAVLVAKGDRPESLSESQFPEEPLVISEAADELVDLESMTKDELLEYAEAQGVEVAKSKTKAEIIEAIESESK